MLTDLDELKTFQRVLALGSLSAAARDLRVGLSVVSKRLATLERRAGVRLINRTTRRLAATEEGLALAAHVERLLDELAAAEAELAGGQVSPRGVLRVACPVSFGRVHLVPVAAALVRAHPDLTIDLRLDDRMTDLVDERLDLAIRIGVPLASAFVMRKLADNHRILAAAPSYLDRRGRPKSPEDLEAHDFLRYGEGDEPWRLDGPGGATASIAAPCRLRANSGEAVADWARAGEGVMLKSWIDVAQDLASGLLERVLPDWRSEALPAYALIPSGRLPPVKVRAFVEAVSARLAQPPQTWTPTT